MTRRALPSQLCRDLLTCAAQLMLCMTAADLAAAPLLSRADPTESAASQSKASQFSHDFAELDSVCHFCTGLTSSPISWQRGHKSASKSSEALSLDSLQLRHINPIHPRRDSDLESPSSDPDSRHCKDMSRPFGYPARASAELVPCGYLYDNKSHIPPQQQGQPCTERLPRNKMADHIAFHHGQRLKAPTSAPAAQPQGSLSHERGREPMRDAPRVGRPTGTTSRSSGLQAASRSPSRPTTSPPGVPHSRVRATPTRRGASSRKGKGRADGEVGQPNTRIVSADNGTLDYQTLPIRYLLDGVLNNDLPPRLRNWWQVSNAKTFGTGEHAVTLSEVMAWYETASKDDKHQYCSATTGSVVKLFRKLAQDGWNTPSHHSPSLEWYKRLRKLPLPDGEGRPYNHQLKHVLSWRAEGEWHKHTYKDIKHAGPFEISLIDKLYAINPSRFARFGEVSFSNFNSGLAEITKKVTNRNFTETSGNRESTRDWLNILFDLRALEQAQPEELAGIKSPKALAALRAPSRSGSPARSKSPPTRKLGSSSAS